MKKGTTPGLIALNETEIISLCAETMETTLTKKQLKKFSVVDLWAIRKGAKPAALLNGAGI